MIWLAVSLFSREPLTSLIRPENGEGDRKEKLEVWIGEEPYSIEVTVRERPKTEAETAEELQKAEVDLQDFEIQHVIESICMTAENKKMTNMEQHDAVIPKKEKNVEIETGRCRITLQPLSFNMVRLAV